MILVTGGSGMVGRALRALLPDAMYLSSKDCNLLDRKESLLFFQEHRPDTVVHLAGKVGGVLANNTYPYDFFYNNILINTNVIEACRVVGVKYLLCMSTVCVYSPTIQQFPIVEDVIFEKEPDHTLYGYGYAKRMMSVQLRCLKRQFGMDSCLIHASNLYGPHDDFDDQNSHVVAALLKKFHNGRNTKSIELHGTGQAMRQITYVGDVAELIDACAQNHITGEFNFANPANVTIKEIAEIIAKVVGFSGEIEFNGQVDGVMRRDVSVEKIMHHLPLVITPFVDGIKNTYQYFLENFA